MKKVAMMAVFLFTMMGSVLAQETKEFKRGAFNHVGLNVGVGLEGVSVGIAAPVTNYLEFEAGVNVMPGINIKGDLTIPEQNVQISEQGYSTTLTMPESTVKAEGSLGRTTMHVKAFAYPFGGNSKFFVAAGFSFGGQKIAKLKGYSPDLAKFVNENAQYKDQILNAVTAELAGYDLKFDDSFSINGDIRCNGFRPYLGLGVGRLVPKKRVGVRFELGCQFMGKLKVYQDGNRLNLDEMLKGVDNGDGISKLVDKLTVYPCLKFSLVGRIL